ncbi:MAG: methionine sulfoxide reductase [Sphingobacteriaceae bacterium]|jgi:hypothetical protein|nr:methionine sulfoxide reductase [Sphingobacteriaceae bacterium]
MKFGKTIKIFLIDGDPNGRMSCELSNWTGKAYKIPRVKIKDCVDRFDINNTGLYLLLGKNDEGQDLVYIGEAEAILKRLNQHLLQKDFWNEAIVFISKDENLNKAHVKYLENRLYEIARSTSRYNLANNVIPTQSSISESDRAEMEEFIENIKLLVNTLGHKVFEEKRDLKSSLKKKQEVFHITSSRGTKAQGIPTSEGFVVFKASKIAPVTTASFPLPMQRLRQKLIDENIAILVDEKLELTEDYIFTSPSAAASIVLGRSANGLTEWTLSDGRSLKRFETNELALPVQDITAITDDLNFVN